MLTPIEIHNAQHKTGRGYSKKEMDEFLADVVASYESVYKENVELKNSITNLWRTLCRKRLFLLKRRLKIR